MRTLLGLALFAAAFLAAGTLSWAITDAVLAPFGYIAWETHAKVFCGLASALWLAFVLGGVKLLDRHLN